MTTTKTIYTSYYYQLQKGRDQQFPEEMKLVVVSNTISRFISREARERLITDYQGVTNPGKTLVEELADGIIDESEYRSYYLLLLDHNMLSHEKQFLDLLKLIYESDSVVLFCHEGPEKFCHRHVLAEWLVRYARELHDVVLETSEWKPVSLTSQV
jgi:uncharacterized protein (DUF488 family)